MAYFQEQLKLGDVPTAPDPNGGFTIDATSSAGFIQLPDLDARSADYKDADLGYDATKEDWSFKGLGLTDDNSPLLYPDSSLTTDEYNKLVADADAPDDTNAPEGGGTPPGESLDGFFPLADLATDALHRFMDRTKWPGRQWST